MKAEKYIAVPVDAELLAAIENGCRESGLKLGPEAARRLRKSYRVGFFAPKMKEVKNVTVHVASDVAQDNGHMEVSHEDANCECHQDVAADGSDGHS